MGYIRIDENSPHHRKMLKAGPAACWLWVCGLAYCQRHRTDGFIPLEALPMLGVGNWKKCAGFLVDAELWHRDEGGYRVHDYLEWNATKDERQQKADASHARVTKWRDDKRARRNSVTPAECNSVTPEACNAAITTSITTSITTPPSPPDAAGRSTRSPLLMSPLKYDQLLQKFAFVGARLRVPHSFHDELRTKLGGENPDSKLRDWYEVLDTEVERTREPIPDVFTWLRPKFVQFASASVSASSREQLVRELEAMNGR
jgi:hypothetical protein